MKKIGFISLILTLALSLSGCFSFLQQGYNVKGVVVNLNDDPIEGVELVADADQAMVETTDDKGNFAFDGLSGSVTISAQKDGYLFTGPYTVNKAETELEIKGVVGSVEVSGEGTVKVTLDDDGKATLTASPANDWLFTKWEGDFEGTDNPASFTFADGTDITAVFYNFRTPEGNLRWSSELLGLPELWHSVFNRDGFEFASVEGLLKVTMSPTYDYAGLANVIIPSEAVKVRVTIEDVSENMSTGLWRLRLTNPETSKTGNIAGGSVPAKGHVEVKPIAIDYLNLIQEGKPVLIDIGGNWTAGEWAVFKVEFLDATDNVVEF